MQIKVRRHTSKRRRVKLQVMTQDQQLLSMLLTAVEFGYKQAERGNNLQQALSEARACAYPKKKG